VDDAEDLFNRLVDRFGLRPPGELLSQS